MERAVRESATVWRLVCIMVGLGWLACVLFVWLIRRRRRARRTTKLVCFRCWLRCWFWMLVQASAEFAERNIWDFARSWLCALSDRDNVEFIAASGIYSMSFRELKGCESSGDLFYRFQVYRFNFFSLLLSIRVILHSWKVVSPLTRLFIYTVNTRALEVITEIISASEKSFFVLK